ncbi:hypothetical protein BKA56DRAFT_613147 [Ilyonectria sp. MPI-CAGE-AT-0026]|nr:hypothetical protein BKA56DRAFT_613147 [Ilyonectria sp. MPI-CAGE-AT-0026]
MSEDSSSALRVDVMFSFWLSAPAGCYHGRSKVNVGPSHRAAWREKQSKFSTDGPRFDSATASEARAEADQASGKWDVGEEKYRDARHGWAEKTTRGPPETENPRVQRNSASCQPPDLEPASPKLTDAELTKLNPGRFETGSFPKMAPGFHPLPAVSPPDIVDMIRVHE